MESETALITLVSLARNALPLLPFVLHMLIISRYHSRYPCTRASHWG